MIQAETSTKEPGQQGQAPSGPPMGAELPPAPPKRKRFWPWVVFALLILFVVIPIIRGAYLASQSDTNASETVVRPPGSGSAHDREVVEGLAGHIARFNFATLPLMTDYLDPTVSATEWVRTAGDHIAEMQRAVAALEADILSIQDEGLRDALGVVPDVLREELDAVTEIQSALADRDRRAEKDALRHLRQAAARRAQLGVILLDTLEPFVDPETLQRVLQEAAANLEPQG